jgi:hypothetical protein
MSAAGDSSDVGRRLWLCDGRRSGAAAGAGTPLARALVVERRT